MNPIVRLKNYRRMFSSALLVLFVLVFCWVVQWSSSAQTRKRTVILAVSAETGEASVDAVAILEGKRLLSPYSDEQKDRQKVFGNEYFKKGTVYRLIFGGGDAGTATVSKWSEGCNNIHAQATLSTSARLGGKVMALATNSETLGKHSVSRRPPTDAERAAVLTLMRSIYQRNRTPASLMPAIKVTNGNGALSEKIPPSVYCAYMVTWRPGTVRSVTFESVKPTFPPLSN